MWVAAVPGNASQIGFPGGGGSAFGGGLGGGGFNGGGGGGGGGNGGGGNSNNNENNQNNGNGTDNPQRKPNPLEAEENRDLLEALCGQFTGAGYSELPQSCGQFSRTARRMKRWYKISQKRVSTRKTLEMWHAPAIVHFRRLPRKFPNKYYSHPHIPIPGISYDSDEDNTVGGSKKNGEYRRNRF